jgi:hypothetical protein
VAPVAIAAASNRFGMSACISANSIIYLMVAALLLYGIRRHMRSSATIKASAASN